MRWLNGIEEEVLEYITTTPFEIRKATHPPKYQGRPFHSLALDEMRRRGLLFLAHNTTEDGSTYKLTPIAAMIRSALKSTGTSI